MANECPQAECLRQLRDASEKTFGFHLSGKSTGHAAIDGKGSAGGS